MRSLGTVAFVGVSGFVLFKIITALLFPMFGLVIALIALAVKVAVVVAVAYFVMEWLKKDRQDHGSVHDVEGPEIEVD
ncbi:MAG: hypothetical protein ACPHQP_00055 [Longimicrobiales bacterium]